LKKIASNFTADIDEIKNFNDLKDDSLKIGEKIIIPNGKLIPKKNKKVITKVKKTVKKAKTSSPVKYKKSNHKLSSFFKRPTSGRTTSLYGKR